MNLLQTSQSSLMIPMHLNFRVVQNFMTWTSGLHSQE